MAGTVSQDAGAKSKYPGIGRKHPSYDGLMAAWALPLALIEGTRSMRSANYLPKYPREKDEDWVHRIATAQLYNAFKRTVRTLSAKPFQKPISFADVPPDLEILAKDADRQGMTQDVFWRRQTSDVLTFGVEHVLVDMPYYDESVTTLADARVSNIHPYFVRVRPDQLTFWEYQSDNTGQLELVEIQIFSCERRTADGHMVERISRWTKLLIEKYHRVPTSQIESERDWDLISSTANKLGKVPLVSSYADVTHSDRMIAHCPLEDLAYLNHRHFLSQSDQDVALHYARVPFLFFAGFQSDDIEKTIAANNAFSSTNPQAKIEYVEPTGAALEQGFKDLDKIEARMEVMGAELLVKRSGDPTATGRSLDAAEKVSDLQAIAVGLDSAAERAHSLAAEWLGKKGVEIQAKTFKDFGLSLKDAAEITFLLNARLAGEIGRGTFLREISRRGLVEDLDIEQEAKDLEAEGVFNAEGTQPQPPTKKPQPEPQPAPAPAE